MVRRVERAEREEEERGEERVVRIGELCASHLWRNQWEQREKSECPALRMLPVFPFGEAGKAGKSEYLSSTTQNF